MHLAVAENLAMYHFVNLTPISRSERQVITHYLQKLSLWQKGYEHDSPSDGYSRPRHPADVHVKCLRFTVEYQGEKRYL